MGGAGSEQGTVDSKAFGAGGQSFSNFLASTVDQKQVKLAGQQETFEEMKKVWHLAAAWGLIRKVSLV